MRPLHVTMLALLLLAAVPIFAQDAATLSEAQYWARLQETAIRLANVEEALPQQRDPILAQIADSWRPVRQVILADTGETLRVDTRWLQLPRSANRDDVVATRIRIEALLAYENVGGKGGLSLEELQALLGEPTEPTNTPPPDRFLNPPPFLGALASVGRLVMIGLGILLVIALLVALARGLRDTVVETPAVNGEADPQTSEAARELAATSEAHADYRAAVRYLYLSSLLRLDESGLIRYDPSLTNREHLRQIGDERELRATLGPIVTFFDRAWYGFAPISDDDYTKFRGYVDELHRMAAEQQS